MEKQLIDVTTVDENLLAERYSQYRELGYYPEFSIKHINKFSLFPSRTMYEVKVFKIVEEEGTD